MPTLNELNALRPSLAQEAQDEYNDWNQAEDGVDDELGAGGICHLIADRMVTILVAAGFEAVSTHSEGMGENHVWVTARTDQGIVTVDIPPDVYEIGGGYCWRKKPNVLFSSDDLEISIIDRNPASFHLYAGEGYEDETPVP